MTTERAHRLDRKLDRKKDEAHRLSPRVFSWFTTTRIRLDARLVDRATERSAAAAASLMGEVAWNLGRNPGGSLRAAIELYCRYSDRFSFAARLKLCLFIKRILFWERVHALAAADLDRALGRPVSTLVGAEARKVL